VVNPNVQVLVQGEVLGSQVADVDDATPEVFITDTSPSNKSTVPRVVEVAAVPPNVMATELSLASPALFAAKVIVPKSSLTPFTRELAMPSGVAETRRLVRSTVWALPLGESKVTVAVWFELWPKAVTRDEVDVFPVSDDVAILKVWRELSVALSLYDATSPFNTRVTELPFPTIIGFAGWN
jgi:hypothetical protein